MAQQKRHVLRIWLTLKSIMNRMHVGGHKAVKNESINDEGKGARDEGMGADRSALLVGACP